MMSDNDFKIGGLPQECAWQAVASLFLKKQWGFRIDFDDENLCVYIDLPNGNRLTFEQ
jgi:hypothetical protein